MDFEQIRQRFLELHPPVYNKNDGYTIYFSEEDKQIINNSKVPHNEDENRQERLSLLLEIRSSMKDNEAALSWANDMIWNECCGFAKQRILMFGEPGREHFGELMDECCKAVFQCIDSYKPEKGTLTTFLTYRILHAISEYTNREINKNTAYYSKNMRAVEKAIQYFKDNGKTQITITDIALRANLSIPKVEVALRNLAAKNALCLDDEMVINTVSKSDSPEDVVLKEEKTEIISSALDELDPYERKILVLHFDLDDTLGKSRSIAKVAKEVGSTPDKVEKVIRKGLKKLRKNKRLAEYYKPPVEIRVEPKIYDTSKIDDFFSEFIDDCIPEGCEDYDSSTKNKSKKSNGEGETTIKW